MKRNPILIAAFTFFITLSSASAQQKTENFLGTWKLAETGNKSAGSMTMTVSEAGGKLIIERSGEGSISSKEAYKISEGTETSVIGGFFGGVEFRRLRFLKANKLQFLTTLKNDYSVRSTIVTWKISEDGKTLTIKHDYRTSSPDVTRSSGGYFSSKLIFTKQ